jgi:hypothetical protein
MVWKSGLVFLEVAKQVLQQGCVLGTKQVPHRQMPQDREQAFMVVWLQTEPGRRRGWRSLGDAVLGWCVYVGRCRN